MLILYSTVGCHLCDQAYSVITRCLANSLGNAIESVPINIVDIADDDDLMRLYAIRIPVVKNQNSNAELGWPFDDEAFLHWYQNLSI